MSEFNKLICELKRSLQQEDVEINPIDLTFRMTSDVSSGNIQCYTIIKVDDGFILQSITSLFELTPEQINQFQISLLNNIFNDIESKDYSVKLNNSKVRPEEVETGYIYKLLNNEYDLTNVNTKVNVPVDYQQAIDDIDRITKTEE